MSEKSICILCEKEAIVESARKEGKTMDAYFVDCKTCKKYYLDAPGMFKQEEMPREKRAMLSAYTRERFELGKEAPEIGDPDRLTEIIAKYERKTIDEKLENLIWYIRKNSPQFGDSVPLDAKKDYPITYSLSLQGFTKILNKLIEQELIESTESGYKLTEDGWRLGTKLLEVKK